MIRPGPKEGARPFQAAKPMAGENRGGRPPAPMAGAGPAVAAGVDPFLQRYGKFPSMEDPKGPRPDFDPAGPNFNPYLGTWIE